MISGNNIKLKYRQNHRKMRDIILGITKNNNITLLDLLDYLYLISFISFSGTIWVNQGILYEYQGYFRMLIMVFPFMASIIRIRRRQNRGMPLTCCIKHCILFCFVYFLIFVLSEILFFNLTAGLVLFVPMCVTLFHLCALETREELVNLLRKFVRIVFVVAAVSLAFFILGSVFRFIYPSWKTNFMWDYPRLADSFFGLYYEPQAIEIMGYVGARNCAIFTEAPMFAFLLCCALLCQFFFLKKGFTPSTIILLITVFTTFSTTAYVAVLALLYFVFLLHPFEWIYMKKVKTIVSIVLAAVLGISIVILLYDKSGTGSFGVRLDHLIGCLKAFVACFPFGCGIENKETLYSFFEYKQGLSVGLPYLFAQLGIFAVIIYGVPLIGAIVLYVRTKHYSELAFLLILQWLFFVTNVAVNAMPIWLMVNMIQIYVPYCFKYDSKWNNRLDISLS